MGHLMVKQWGDNDWKICHGQVEETFDTALTINHIILEIYGSNELLKLSKKGLII